jgi:eukaryotic-like serine/threonine-protein kinase
MAIFKNFGKLEGLVKYCPRIALIAIASMIGLAPCHAADWPAFRGNEARTGFYPDAVGVPSGKALWKTSLGCEIVSSPSVAGNVLYIGGRDSCIYAIDCMSGRVLWKVRTGGWVDASPLVVGSRLVAGSRDSTIYALNKVSGLVLGSWAAGLQLSSPALAADSMIISGMGLPGGGIAGYTSEAFGWDRVGPRWTISFPQYTYSSPAIRGQAAVIGATDGKFYAINTETRDTIWSIATGGGIYLSTPAIDNMTVFLAPGDDDRNVYAVDLLTGKMLWKSQGVPASADPGASLKKRQNIRLLPATDRNRLKMLSPADRKRIIVRLRNAGIELPRVAMPVRAGGLAKKHVAATADFIPLQGIRTSSVAVGANKLFVVQKELGYLLNNDSLVEDKQRFALQALDKKTGTPVWSFSEFRAGSHLGYCSSPVATAAMVFFGWGEGRVYGLSAETGEKLWEDSTQGHIVSSPAIADGMLYVATLNGTVNAYALLHTLPGLDFKTSTYCYPNPARGGVSHIQVYIDREADATMTISTMADQPVASIKRHLSPSEAPYYGKYPFYDWDLSKVANGVYFARIKVSYVAGGEDKKTLKIAVLK